MSNYVLVGVFQRGTDDRISVVDLTETGGKIPLDPSNLGTPMQIHTRALNQEQARYARKTLDAGKSIDDAKLDELGAPKAPVEIIAGEPEPTGEFKNEGDPSKSIGTGQQQNQGGETSTGN